LSYVTLSYYIYTVKQINMKVNKLNLIGALIAIIICRMTMTGQILNWITFSDVLGEIFFFMLSAMLAIGLLITSFEKVAE